MLKKKTNSIATNRRASYDYKIGDKFEAGIVLKGSEVKSLRNNRVDISHAFISNENGEIFLKNSSIPQYLSSGMLNHEVSRSRKLLFKKKEIKKKNSCMIIHGQIWIGAKTLQHASEHTA